MTLRRISQMLIRIRSYCKTTNTDEVKMIKFKDGEQTITIPDPPTTCCMSGCQNCVWIEYSKELTTLYQDSGKVARKVIRQKIQDPSIQMFLQLELRKIELDKNGEDVGNVESDRSNDEKQ